VEACLQVVVTALITLYHHAVAAADVVFSFAVAGGIQKASRSRTGNCGCRSSDSCQYWRRSTIIATDIVRL
jgi:hypothetical protein